MMNCENAQRDVLLDQSGELPSARQSMLTKHLAGCAACRAYREASNQVLTMSRTAPLESDISEFTIRRIAVAAERNLHPAGARRARGSVLELWRPALISGAAAVLVLLLAVTYIRRDSAQLARAPASLDGTEEIPAELLVWDPPLDDEFASLTTLLSMTIDEHGAQETTDSLDSLAEELLELESWSI